MVRIYTDLEGPGSQTEIEKYIKEVMEEHTELLPNANTTFERMARAITKSVLNRLSITN